ncbi:hypothetical protein Scep_019567 [Stephania cephalantha]|uniref:Uncharacterized protein n=1 Tax=Stephania cephalantha TaxID=152367 RepID=A0AAP0IB35_9MAGN
MPTPFNNTAATAKRPFDNTTNQRPEEYQPPNFAAAKIAPPRPPRRLFENTTAVVAEYRSPSSPPKTAPPTPVDSSASSLGLGVARVRWSPSPREEPRVVEGVIGDGGRRSRKEAERGE